MISAGQLEPDALDAAQVRGETDTVHSGQHGHDRARAACMVVPLW